ncbi:MAG: zinc ribbon domain-containing protein [Chloroflexi bacterium]|nr:zinc ribbon domain-containing protein [Chloroflexota bacterium]
MSGIGYQLRKSFDRVGFEADRLMRANRVRAEANRLKKQAESQTRALGQKVIDMSGAGVKLDPELQAIVDEIVQMQAEVQSKNTEIEAINAEEWVEPPPPSPPPPAPAAIPPQLSPQPQLQQGGVVPTGTAPQTSQEPVIQSTPGSETPSAQADISCPVCHNSIRAGSTFCPHCGYKLNS